MGRANAPGVLCLEGEWGERLAERTSVEPALELLERSGVIRLIHRDIATRGELEHYLDRAMRKSFKGFDLIFLAFHGSPETLWLGKDCITFSELEEVMAGRCTGKIIHFGSCQVLAADDEVLIQFCRRTGARAVVGYTKDVDIITTAAFEILLVAELVNSRKMKPAYDRLVRQHPVLTVELGFRMAHAQWTSDRRVALRASSGPTDQ
ncbi:DUF6642 family protein [Rhodococcus indonesiensis]